ncbi:vacuolar protein sorting 41 [Coprinopsis cinerea okayama7|uniref:Vacuolar protein sorting 41 n=1 Tax=Coprinopsis cinerea (strain Okayama-7 / 130 / ATCC MYA-4618 / FGSC 9003) TaxID=240176 RepID=A8P6F2_COPC7|nr:vacuolar protein sorting 41 [Coprinopsis cinerea okayama7\|eukprot:XP_001839145.2 vacuolar protein sorting 41 [Coprinopsis cinerea okayama7\
MSNITGSEEEDDDDGDDDDDDESEEGDDESGEGSEDDDEDEDEDDDEDDDDEEEEPALKYSRIEGAVPDLLKKDSASAIAISGNRLIALGTHAGIVHIMDLTGKRLKSYKPHLASIVDIEFDETGDWVATASIDGQVHVRSVSLTAPASSEHYSFDLKRPMRTIALEPQFASKRSTRAFVCGGLAGNLIMYEKGWLGHRETIIASGEGPIWTVRWVGIGSGGSNGLIAWANDSGVKIYHPSSKSLLTYIDRAPNSPRSELFKPTLHWQDEGTLLIAWADFIKVVRIRARSPHLNSPPPSSNGSKETNLAPFTVEIQTVFQMDGCAVAGIAPHPMPSPSSSPFENMDYSRVLDDKFDRKSHHSRAPSTGTAKTFETESDDHRSTHSQRTKPGLPTNGAYLRASTPQRRSSMPIANSPPLTTFLLLTYIAPPSLLKPSPHDDEQIPTETTATKRSAAQRPELTIVSRSTGEELANDILGVRDFEKWGCNEYSLGIVRGEEDDLGTKPRPSQLGPHARNEDKERCYVVMSPRDLVLVRKRDLRDRVQWLVERAKWEEALKEVEKLEQMEAASGRHRTSDKDREGEENEDHLTVHSIGDKYMDYLVDEGEYDKAASLAPKVCGRGTGPDIEKRWDKWIWKFAERKQLHTIIPYVPTEAPRLDHLLYEMILGHFMARDLQALLKTIQTWPKEIYDISAVIVAVKAQLDKLEKGGPLPEHYDGVTRQEAVVLLMECLAELFTANRQPGKALPYFLRLRRPNVFELIRENNLFTDVQDQILLLVEFDHELMERRRKEREEKEKAKEVEAKDGGVKAKDYAAVASSKPAAPATPSHEGEVKQWQQSEAIQLLTNNIHSIPINRVVQQLQNKPYYLFLYLDALVEKDPHLVSAFADLQVRMYAEFAVSRLIDFLRTSTYYNLEKAYNVCKERDLVPEMVFLLGRMGNNKKALTLIIERLGDVERAIEFAKAQNDDDLWEDLLRYSETRPTFIRGLLENVGVEISPIRLIRRIRNGLEIPGLKEALIKILQDFHLQIELLEGCKTILEGDCAELAELLGRRQGGGLPLGVKSKCPVCMQPLLFHQHLIPPPPPQTTTSSLAPSKPKPDTPNADHQQQSSLALVFLCRHVVHASCAGGNLNHLPLPTDPVLRSVGYGSRGSEAGRAGSRGAGMSGIIAL